MRVGATISDEHMNLLRATLPQIQVSPKYSWPLADSNLRAPAKKQLLTALANYKNDGTPWDFSATRCGRIGCSMAQSELASGQKLLYCSKCKVTMYCCKDCQAQDWKSHKITCKIPQEETTNESASSWRLLNV
jgi:hypothetical protein